MILCFTCLVTEAHAASFPGTAYVTTSDPTGALSWNPSASAMTVECWFKILDSVRHEPDR